MAHGLYPSPEIAQPGLELEGVYRILSKLICFKNQIVRLYVNLNVVRILSKGSMKQDLQNVQNVAVNILNMCNINHVIIVPEWIPRENNTIADRLSRFAYTDCDDWMVSAELFQILNTNWGPFTVDRFASELNKCERFNSKIWYISGRRIESVLEVGIQLASSPTKSNSCSFEQRYSGGCLRHTNRTKMVLCSILAGFISLWCSS